MHTSRPPPLNLHQARLKQRQSYFEKDGAASAGGVGGGGGCSSGSLSPNLQPATPPTFPAEPFVASQIGDYVLLDQLEGSALYRAVHTGTKEDYVCKVVPTEKHREALLGHFRLDGHEHVNVVSEVLVGASKTYVFFGRSYGDLHSYVRSRRRLREAEALHLFSQVARAVAACHEAGLVLRDLKLRKFVFKDPARTELKLETLDDAVLLEEGDSDQLCDKHGCPAYVSPEILSTSGSYSGRAADCWSLGVMLYTMLVGRYPFHYSDPAALFSNIRRGAFTVPDSLSSKAKCLLRSLLRREPAERLTADEVLDHPWFRLASTTGGSKGALHPSVSSGDRGRGDEGKVPDQTVPDMALPDDGSSMFA